MRFASASALLILVGCAPMGQTPGLRLGGTEAPAPTSFEFVKDHEEIQLEARGAVFPRVVNIWGVGTSKALYVWGDPDSGWVRRVAERPDEVRVRIGDQTFELQAGKVTDNAEKLRVVAGYQAKYGEDLDAIFGRPSTADDFELLYRLSPR
jgi:hypothetical protein